MSGPADPFAYVEDWHRRFSQTGWWHSFELPDSTLIEGVHSLDAQKQRIARFPIPADLTGKRVLDIGPWDGWFTFEMERRGAEVVAIDRWDNPRFREMHAALGSRADYRQLNVYEISPAALGQFDVVLFLGVLYHLKHPLLALERVCSVTRSFAAVESFALTERYLPGMQVEQYPLLQFFERDGFGGQFDNWFAATPQCLLGMCRTAGFARAELIEVHDYGAAVACYRHWNVGQASRPVFPDSVAPGANSQQPDRPGGLSHLQPAPKLFTAIHAENFGINFRSTEDDYVQCEAADSEPWTIDNVQPEAGGFASAPVSVLRAPEGHWRCNFKLPPGLPAGWHQVRVRRAGSEWSNPARIAVDLPERTDSIETVAVCDAFDWKQGSFSLRHRFFSMWVRGLPENADRANVKVELGGEGSCPARRQSVDFVGDADMNGSRQVNVLADARLTPGRYRVQAEFGGVRSAEFQIEATLP
jgi:tRNA (mo5U34)-methyltransferase